MKLLEVCEAVHYLHSLDILHRDIKPENIVISNVIIYPYRESASYAISGGLHTVKTVETPTVGLSTMFAHKFWKENLMITLWMFGQLESWLLSCSWERLPFIT